MLQDFKAALTGAHIAAIAITAALLFVAGGLSAWFAPWVGGAAQVAVRDAKVIVWRNAYEDWRRYGKGEKAAFDESERLRTVSENTAQAATNGADLQCTTRVAAARSSAVAIYRLTHKEPVYDPSNGCAVRRLADPGELRDALQPPAPVGGR